MRRARQGDGSIRGLHAVLRWGKRGNPRKGGGNGRSPGDSAPDIMKNTHSFRRSALVIGITVGVVAGGVAGGAAAAPPPQSSVSGSGYGSSDGERIYVSMSFTERNHLFGSMSYYDGHRWLSSTRPGALKVNGRIAKVKGEGRWNHRDVIYYVQVRDRSPKRRDTITVKVKAGKQVVLRQSAALTTGDLVVR